MNEFSYPDLGRKRVFVQGLGVCVFIGGDEKNSRVIYNKPIEIDCCRVIGFLHQHLTIKNEFVREIVHTET